MYLAIESDPLERVLGVLHRLELVLSICILTAPAPPNHTTRHTRTHTDTHNI